MASDNENGNGNGKVVSIVASAILVAALGGWVAAGNDAKKLAQEAKDKATAAESKAASIEAVVNVRLQKIEERQREDSETLKSIWRAMNDRNDRRREDR